MLGFLRRPFRKKPPPNELWVILKGRMQLAHVWGVSGTHLSCIIPGIQSTQLVSEKDAHDPALFWEIHEHWTGGKLRWGDGKVYRPRSST
jgi:hypothetical protein